MVNFKPGEYKRKVRKILRKMLLSFCFVFPEFSCIKLIFLLLFFYSILDCIVTGWSPWTPCSKNCCRGKTFRIRKIIKSEKNGGVPCPTRLRDRRKCVAAKCPSKNFSCSERSMIPCMQRFLGHHMFRQANK